MIFINNNKLMTDGIMYILDKTDKQLISSVIWLDKKCVTLITASTVKRTKSDSDVIFCLQVISKTLTYTLDFSNRESIAGYN